MKRLKKAISLVILSVVLVGTTGATAFTQEEIEAVVEIDDGISVSITSSNRLSWISSMISSDTTITTTNANANTTYTVTIMGHKTYGCYGSFYNKLYSIISI